MNKERFWEKCNGPDCHNEVDPYGFILIVCLDTLYFCSWDCLATHAFTKSELWSIGPQEHEKYVKAFWHVYVQNMKDLESEKCTKCGLSLRDDIHSQEHKPK